MNDLIAYRVASFDMKLVPAPPTRQWMDDTREGFANRCLPLLIANQAGWLILNDRRFLAVWNGEDDLDSVVIAQTGTPPYSAVSHFGHGILTFTLPFLFRTPPDIKLCFRGPANEPKDAIVPLEGLVETDWSVATATMNWKFTRPDVWIEFDQEEPICMIVPQRLDLLENISPRIVNIASDPKMYQDYLDWSQNREGFIERLRDWESAAVNQGWQRDYFREAASKHRSRLGLREFEDENSK
jgi:hypothetical protein